MAVETRVRTKQKKDLQMTDDSGNKSENEIEEEELTNDNL